MTLSSLRISGIALTTLLAMLGISREASAQPACTTTVPAGLVAGQTWDLAGSPYCITGDIQATLLTVDPGVEVFVDGPFGITVLSTITIVGTAAEPVMFSSKLPSAPDNQRWKGFKFSNTPPGSTFEHVFVQYSDDGGLTLTNAFSPVLQDCHFHNNSRAGEGGAIQVTGGPDDLTIESCVFSQNSSASHGGALSIDLNAGFSLNISNSSFAHNTANPARVFGDFVGGAIFLPDDNAVIETSYFQENRANAQCSGTFGCNVTARGGAIWIGSGDDVVIRDSLITENQADALNQGGCGFGGTTNAFGGGVYVNTGIASVANTIISCNRTTPSNCRPSTGGGGLYVNGGSASMANVTVARNAQATGIHLAAGSMDVTNSIIFHNLASVGGNPTISYSTVEGGYPSGTDINPFDPVFAGLGCGETDFPVVIGSFAIDGGNDLDAGFDDACLPPGQMTTTNDQGAFGGPGNCTPLPEPMATLGLAFGCLSLLGLARRRA